MAKKIKNEVRPVVETPVKVCLKKRASGLSSGYSRKVLPSMTVTEEDIEQMAHVEKGTVAKIMDATAACVRLGRDVVLCGGLRFYGVVDKSGKLINASQTINEYRTCVNDVKYVTVHRDNRRRETVVSNEEAQAVVEGELAKRRGFICVSPDMVVTCPKCGFGFRVGKVLASEK